MEKEPGHMAFIMQFYFKCNGFYFKCNGYLLYCFNQEIFFKMLFLVVKEWIMYWVGQKVRSGFYETPERNF